MIQDAIKLLEGVRDAGNPQIIVGVSGGKDSLVTLDLCCRVFHPSHVHAFFLFLIEGLESEQRYLRFVESRYKIRIHHLRHPDMAHYLRTSWLSRQRTPEIEELIRRNFKWSDVEAIMRARTGVKWFAYGHRITDSLQRRAMIQGHKGVIQSRRVCYPIWDWKPREVFSYLRSNALPIPPMMGSRVDRTSGIAPHSVECLLYLKKNFPDDFEKIVSVFPRSLDLIERDVIRAKYEIQKNSPAAV